MLRTFRLRFHYAWLILGIAFVTLIVAAAVRSAPSILIVPLEREFGWTRAQLSFAVSVNILLYGLVGPFAAGLYNRFGLRRIMVGSLVLLAAGVAATIGLRTVWQLTLLWGVLVGLGSGMLAIVLGTTIVHRWFERHQGLAIGLLTASSATGQLLFLPVLASVVENAGWRWAMTAVVGAIVLVLLLVALAMRDRPADLGLYPLGAEADMAELPLQNPVAQAFSALGLGLRNRNFWFLAGSFFVCGASTNGLIGTHLVPACMDHGLPEVQAASLLAVMGICDLIGTTASGWLSDRFDSRWLLFCYYSLRGLSLLFLPLAFDPTFTRLPVFAVFYGLDWIATVPPTVALTAQIFGRERVGLMFGWIAAAHQVGASLTAYLAGQIRTWEGSYDQAFLLSGLGCVLTGAAVLFIDSGGRVTRSKSKRTDPVKIQSPALEPGV